VELYRVFDWDGRARGRREGGPLFVARTRQGAGRHDSPARYGAWYCSRLAVSAVAESIQHFRGQLLVDDDFRRAGRLTKALVALRLGPGVRIVDLDDPAELTARGWRPSQVATRRRPVTQQLAATLFDEGAGGLAWWSVLDADWINVTLFHERALPFASIAAAPRPLSIEMSEVREAAERLGVTLVERPARR
jgi:hypothetical protein